MITSGDLVNEMPREQTEVGEPQGMMPPEGIMPQ